MRLPDASPALTVSVFSASQRPHSVWPSAPAVVLLSGPRVAARMTVQIPHPEVHIAKNREENIYWDR